MFLPNEAHTCILSLSPSWSADLMLCTTQNEKQENLQGEYQTEFQVLHIIYRLFFYSYRLLLIAAFNVDKLLNISIKNAQSIAISFCYLKLSVFFAKITGDSWLNTN